MSYRVCYFVCFGEKAKSVFCVRFRQISKTHVLYRCMFTHIQLWNSVIQRVDCMRFATFVHLAHLWEWGQCTVAAIVWGGQGVNKKQRKHLNTWNYLQKYVTWFFNKMKAPQILKCLCFPTGSDLNKWPEITYVWLETCDLISRILAHTETVHTQKVES